MQPHQSGPVRIKNDKTLSYFDVEVSSGTVWTSLNDLMNYRVNAEDFGERAQTLRRVTATSPFYDGTFLVHSTLENVEEKVNVYVYGASQNHVTENMLALLELFAQDSYNVRVSMNDHVETWLCQPADYSIDRTHVMAHNGLALVKFAVPRMPKVTYEVNL